MIPTVVIVGRPNVGKSTLFNRLVGRRAALVANVPGLTRDRKEERALLRGRSVLLVDTAGLDDGSPETTSGRIHAGTMTAVQGADVVLFVTDAQSGVLASDKHFARWLRRQHKPIILVANKTEGRSAVATSSEFFELGFGNPILISAEHGEGIAHLMSEIADLLPSEQDGESEFGTTDSHPIRLAIVGRPNVGKSTLLNRLIGVDRAITGPEPGLTRDSVAIVFHDESGKTFELIDTAGLRRRERIDAPEEKLSTHASIEALKAAEVVILTVDATVGIQEQDLRIARLIESKARGCVIVLNKWDAVENQQSTWEKIGNRLEATSANLRMTPLISASALFGIGVEKVLPEATRVWETWSTRVQTASLNRWLATAVSNHPPPMVRGRRLKLRFITQVKSRPPTFIVFGTGADATPDAYRSYLSNSLRNELKLEGSPVRLHFRSPENPFA